jgi:sugar phosphate isomerase/epimerase
MIWGDRMKIGVCTGVDNISIAEMIGFDYLEPAVSAVASMEEVDFEKSVKLVEESNIKCEVFNIFFPGTIKLFSEDFSMEVIDEYVRKAFKRIKTLGAEIAVFGSGGARKIPEGMSDGFARTRMQDVLIFIGDIAKEFDINVAIEPLNTRETNNINSVADALELKKKIDHPNIKLLADFYHMRMEIEDMVILNEAALDIIHLHIANSNKRVYPRDAGEDAYEEFFEMLKTIGYSGRLSIEVSGGDLKEDGPGALSLLRELTLKKGL